MKVYVEDAEVERVFRTEHGYGVGVVETREAGGRTFTQRATLWFKASPDLRQGDRVNASGYLSARARSYEKDGETKWVADVSLNGALVQSVVQGAPAVEEAPEDPWGGETTW